MNASGIRNNQSNSVEGSRITLVAEEANRAIRSKMRDKRKTSVNTNHILSTHDGNATEMELNLWRIMVGGRK